MEKSNILKQQQDFAEKEDIKIDEGDNSGRRSIPFSNLLDKGYRIVRLAFSYGYQKCIQPIFAKSDRCFSSKDMLVSATVATDRSGNERAVKYCKMAGWLRKGLHQRACPDRMNKVWLGWSFQTNFMYKSVV